MYKFKNWIKHNSTGLEVTKEEKEKRANQIADKLCKHSDWLTHGRSIPLKELEKMGLKITDYSKLPELNDAISRYYTLLIMTLESTNIFKVIETTTTQILRFAVPNSPNMNVSKLNNQHVNNLFVNVECPNCKQKMDVQIKLSNEIPTDQTKVQYPKNDNLVCGKCKTNINLVSLRLQIESETGKKIII